MSIIDKQRIAAVETLQALGYTFWLADGWIAPAAGLLHAAAVVAADAMHALLYYAPISSRDARRV